MENLEKNNTTKTNLPAQTAKETAETKIKQLGANVPAIRVKALDLAQTIKAVTDLHALIRQRDRLELYRDKLKDFEVLGKEEDIETKSILSYCTLTIQDDKRNAFEIKSPAVIRATVEFLHKQFDIKLTEVEAKIKLPISA